MEGAEFDLLVEDIRTNGQREPIKTWHDLLIDGRNRERACKAAKVEPHYKEMKFKDDYEVIAFVISENIVRRHLDPGQRAMLGEALRPQLADAAKKRQEAGMAKGRIVGAKARSAKTDSGPKNGATVDRSGRVDNQLGNMLNVGKSTIAQAHKVATEAPELAAKVRSGEMKLGAAYKATTRKNHRTPELTDVTKQALAIAVLDQGKTLEQVAEQFGLASVQPVKIAVAEERGARRQAQPASLSMTAQEKLDAAITREKAKLQAEFWDSVNKQVHQFWRETFLPIHKKEQDQAKAIMNARKGVMDKITFRKIWTCLHTERLAQLLSIPHDTLDPATAKRYAEAFNLFSGLEKLLLDEKNSPTPWQNLDVDWKARKQAKQAKRGGDKNQPTRS
jgi:hypothetical protein